MPRTRKVPWGKRISIFLDFRQSKKVYPTAKRHGIARSTVSAIIDEFREMGFSDAPRPDLSKKILTLAQKHHLRDVTESLQQAQLVILLSPGEGLRGGLSPEDALSEEAIFLAGQIDPLPLQEPLVWHLEGTEAAQMVQESKQAIRSYSQRCLKLWQEIRKELEDRCGLSVQPHRGHHDGEEPAIFHSLIDVVYVHLLSVACDQGKLVNDFPRWDVLEHNPQFLRANGKEVAFGQPEDHLRVKQGVELLLGNESQNHTQSLSELNRLFHDLEYVKLIAEAALTSVTEEEINRGVCPACPYPEIPLSSSEENLNR